MVKLKYQGIDWSGTRIYGVFNDKDSPLYLSVDWHCEGGGFYKWKPGGKSYYTIRLGINIGKDLVSSVTMNNLVYYHHHGSYCKSSFDARNSKHYTHKELMIVLNDLAEKFAKEIA